MAGRVPRVCNYNSQMKAEGKEMFTVLGTQKCLMKEQKNGSTASRIGQSPINHQSMTI